MKAQVEWRGGTITVDFSRGRSLAIEINPRGSGPSFFSESEPRVTPLQCGDFVGDMALGASCNADVFEFSPHSHGTHTECIGHISQGGQTVTGTIDPKPTLMRLISVPSESLQHGQFIPESAIARARAFDGGALAIRNLPNDPSKQWRDYGREPGYPVFSPEAMAALSASILQHLLIDAPSLDRADSNRLENHSMWWGLNITIPHMLPSAAARSLTEMIYVPDDIADGDYWLDLQLAPIVSDAVPSRPVIYPVTRTALFKDQRDERRGMH